MTNNTKEPQNMGDEKTANGMSEEDRERMKAATMHTYRQLCDTRCGGNQKKAAEMIGISPTSFKNYLTGANLPGMGVLLKTGRAFDVSLDWLTGESDFESRHIPDSVSDIGLSSRTLSTLARMKEDDLSTVDLPIFEAGCITPITSMDIGFEDPDEKTEGEIAEEIASIRKDRNRYSYLTDRGNMAILREFIDVLMEDETALGALYGFMTGESMNVQNMKTNSDPRMSEGYYLEILRRRLLCDKARWIRMHGGNVAGDTLFWKEG